MLAANPLKQLVTRAAIGRTANADCCYICDRLLPARTLCVIITLENTQLLLGSGRFTQVHICLDCYGKHPYPPVKNPGVAQPDEDTRHPVLRWYPEVDPKLFEQLRLSQEPGRLRAIKAIMEREWGQKKRNPPLVVRVWEITKHPPAGVCSYCHGEIAPGERCIAVRYYDHNVYGHSSTAYLHIGCWHRAGNYPPLYDPERRTIAKEQGQLFGSSEKKTDDG